MKVCQKGGRVLAFNASNADPEYKECKGRIEGSVCAFNCSNTDPDCKECKDKR
jgi:hypothetical protein